MADWSSGQDAALSRRKQGFDSPISCFEKVYTIFSIYYDVCVADAMQDMADWSSGQDAALSRRKQGFDSPISC